MSNVSNNSNKSENSNFVKNSINFIQITSPIPSDLLHPTYNVRKRDTETEYLGIIQMTLRNCIKDINFTDPVQMRRVHRDLMNEANSEYQYISNRYNIEIDPLHFEWDKFIPTLERQLPDIFNEMLNCDHQGHPLDQSDHTSIISRNREPNNTFRQRVNFRTPGQ